MALIKTFLRLINADDTREQLAPSFREELHFQSSRIVIFASIASVIWLLYIPIDRELHPDQPVIITLRWLLMVVGGIALLLYSVRSLRAKSQLLLVFWGGYLILAAAAISGLSGNDPTYLPGYILTLCFLPMAPLEKRYAFSVLFCSVFTFVLTSLYDGADFSALRMRYSVNDLLAATIAISFFIYILDRIRHASWANAKVIEAESRKKVDQARAESRAKSRFLATMSHEIRTPMNGVIGMTELLNGSHLDPQQRQYVEVISNSGKALLNIINDILDYSKIEAGKLELESVDFDLDKLCLDVASVFSLTSEKKQLEFLVAIKPGTPVFIKSDPTRLRQILLNLLGNAFKFTPRGGIYLRVSSVSHDPKLQTHTLKFEIQDTGIGMTTEQMAQLFEAFTQADSTTTRQFGGTGLGLSISKSLAELMGGEIGMSSTQGEGSTFWFTVQCAPAAETFVRQHELSVDSLIGQRVLFVDDSVEFTQVVVEQANGWGMHAEASYHGEDALRRLQLAQASGKPFDIVSLDMNMPGMSGLEIAQALQADPPLAASKRVLLTAMRVTPPRDELQQAGISEAIQKPASARTLKECFLRLTGRTVPAVVRDLTERRLPLAGANVLVAEDNDVNQIVIKSMLKKLGVQCTIANNGISVLQVFADASPPFDLILMDCEMPEMDGFSATRAIRQQEKDLQRPPTPIIALTAHAMKEHQLLCHECGMDDCLSKPIELDTLEDKLIAFLREADT